MVSRRPVLAELDDGAGDFALVEGVPAAVGNGLEGAGQVFLAQISPGFKRSAVLGEHRLRRGKLHSRESAAMAWEAHGWWGSRWRPGRWRGHYLGQGQDSVLGVAGQPAIEQARTDTLSMPFMGMPPGR